MSSTRQALYKLIEKWQNAANKDDTEQFKYRALLDDLFDQIDMRFNDYVQFDIDGPFPYRLKKWLENLKDEHDQKTLFRSLNWLFFIDKKQMQSLYRDSFRSKIELWIISNYLQTDDLFATDYYRKILGILRSLYFCSITESFSVSYFKQVNSLVSCQVNIIG